MNGKIFGKILNSTNVLTWWQPAFASFSLFICISSTKDRGINDHLDPKGGSLEKSNLLARTSHTVHPTTKGARKYHPIMYLEREKESEHLLNSTIDCIVIVIVFSIMTMQIFTANLLNIYPFVQNFWFHWDNHFSLYVEFPIYVSLIHCLSFLSKWSFLSSSYTSVIPDSFSFSKGDILPEISHPLSLT